MKTQAESHQYTIRGVSADVDRVLRKRAAEKKLSLNQVILDELANATIGQRAKIDLSDVAGRWTPDPEFDEIIASQRQIDWDKWR